MAFNVIDIKGEIEFPFVSPMRLDTDQYILKILWDGDKEELVGDMHGILVFDSVQDAEDHGERMINEKDI